MDPNYSLREMARGSGGPIVERNGRTLTFQEAVEIYNGEALKSRTLFEKLLEQEKKALLDVLGPL